MRVDFLSTKEARGLKGILALMVLIHHLSGRSQLFSSSLLGAVFAAFGYLAVSGFFFLSGYGLYTRYQQSGTDYINGFFRKKVLPLYGIYVLAHVIYTLRDLIFDGTVNWNALVKSLLMGNTIVNFGWYMQAQIILYVLFGLVFSFIKQQTFRWIIIGTCIYCAVCIMMKLTSKWYEAIFCFPMGIICAQYRDKIPGWFEKPKKWLFSLGFGLCVFLITLFLGNRPIFPEPIRIFVKIISSLCFVGVIVIGITWIRLSCVVTDFLGKLSLEIYLLQGLFLVGLRPVISNGWLYMGAVTVGTILLSMAFNPLFSWVSVWLAGKHSPTIKKIKS